MKPVREIVEETVAAYTLYTRAQNEKGACQYITNDGRMCAVGRCALHPDDLEDQLFCLHDMLACEVDMELKPEYRGHKTAFWIALQGLHDCRDFWCSSGITVIGRAAAEDIIQRFEGSDAQ